MRVFVLLFNAGTENEGIHTIRIGDRDKVLMFESEDDATRYALLLEAQDFPTPTVEEIDSEEVEQFCRSADYDYEIVSAGNLEIPPETSLEETDWQVESKKEKSENSSMSPEELEKIRRRLEGLL